MLNPAHVKGQALSQKDILFKSLYVHNNENTSITINTCVSGKQLVLQLTMALYGVTPKKMVPC